MLPKLELHRGSSMDFSSGTMAGFRKVEEGIEEEIERRVKREHSRTSAHADTMDGNEDTQTRLEPHVTYEHICAMHLQTVRSVLRTMQCSRQCALWCSCNWSQCAQDCRCCA